MPCNFTVFSAAGVAAAAAAGAGSIEPASPVGDSVAQPTDISEEAMKQMFLAAEGQPPPEDLTASVSEESAARVGVKSERKHSAGKRVGGKSKLKDSKQQGSVEAENNAVIEQGDDGDSQSLWDRVKGGVGGAAGAVAGTAVGTWGGVKGWWAARKEAEREREAEELRGGDLHEDISTYQ